MSHVVTIKTELRSLEAIRLACKRLGWEFRENQKSYHWYGNWMGDSPIPEELLTPYQLARVREFQAKGNTQEIRRFMKSFMGTCDHAITVPNCAYEIGLLERTDEHGRTKYLLAYDYWETGGLDRVMPTKEGDPNLFAQAYAIEVAKQQATMDGYSIEEQTQSNGTVVLTLGDYR